MNMNCSSNNQISLYPLSHRYNVQDLLFDSRIYLTYNVLEKLNLVHGQIVSKGYCRNLGEFVLRVSG